MDLRMEFVIYVFYNLKVSDFSMIYMFLITLLLIINCVLSIRNTNFNYNQKFLITLISLILVLIHLIIMIYFIHVTNILFEESIKLKLEKIKVSQEQLEFMYNIKNKFEKVLENLYKM